MKMANSILSTNRILASLSPGDASRLGPLLKPVSLEQGYVIKAPGEETEHVYFPHAGTISLLCVMRNGSSVETAIVGREGIVGAMAGLGLQLTPMRAVAQAPVIASRIAVRPFRNAMIGSDALRDLVLRWSEVLLAQILMTGACNALHPIGARLARRILQARDRIDDDAIPLTQQQLSEILGVRRSSISEVAGTFLSMGLIRYRRGRIEIMDRAGLEQVACECHETIAENVERLLSALWRGTA
ncbi:MAG TPA: Crp/Fnr family transcriptional regulator [Stellaceae bacterium]|nr:Crp/Fnr family transcriptional regulator [Stellaceae bacterium]